MNSFAEAISCFTKCGRHKEMPLESRKQIIKGKNVTSKLYRFQNLGAFFLNIALTKYYYKHQLVLGNSLTNFLNVHLSHRNLNRVAEQLINHGRLGALGYEALGEFPPPDELDLEDEANLYTHTLQVAGMIYVDRISNMGITNDNKLNMTCDELYDLSYCWKKFELLMDPFFKSHSFDECIKGDKEFEKRMEGVHELGSFVDIDLKKEDSEEIESSVAIDSEKRRPDEDERS